MAKFLPSAVVDQVRNKIGSSVFTKTKAGPMIRKKVAPTQPHTARQTTVRSGLSDLAKAWSGTLTAVQRAGWNALAATIRRADSLGTKYTLTGLQLYASCNANLDTINQAHIAAAPANLVATALQTITPAAAAGAGTFSLAFTDTPAAANHYVVAEATPQGSAGRYTSLGNPAFIAKGAAATASPLDIFAAYTAKYGALVAGKKITVAAYVVNSTNGAASRRIQSTITVAA